MSGIESGAIDYVIRVHADPSEIHPREWNELLAAQVAPLPFMRHEYLKALHDSGSAAPDAGWSPGRRPT
jgi:predicted N-acyltransferase